MAKFPLILPDDPEFLDLPPPPSKEEPESFLYMLARVDADEQEDEEQGQNLDAERVAPSRLGSADCHVEIGLGEARLDAYLDLRVRTGTQHAVLVQSREEGSDHSIFRTSLERLRGEAFDGDAVGVAKVGADTSEKQLVELSEAGVVAQRFLMRENHADWVGADRLAGRVGDLVGWDAMLQMDGRYLHEVEPRLRDWPKRILLEHCGSFLGPVRARDAGMQAVMRLIDKDKLWVILAGPEESSQAGGPEFRGIEPIARELIRFAPERMIWGSNWPGKGQGDNVGAHLPTSLSLLARWADDDSVFQRILTHNPQELFGFSPTSSDDQQEDNP